MIEAPVKIRQLEVDLEFTRDFHTVFEIKTDYQLNRVKWLDENSKVFRISHQLSFGTQTSSPSARESVDKIVFSHNDQNGVTGYKRIDDKYAIVKSQLSNYKMYIYPKKSEIHQLKQSLRKPIESYEEMSNILYNFQRFQNIMPDLYGILYKPYQYMREHFKLDGTFKNQVQHWNHTKTVFRWSKPGIHTAFWKAVRVLENCRLTALPLEVRKEVYVYLTYGKAGFYYAVATKTSEYGEFMIHEGHSACYETVMIIEEIVNGRLTRQSWGT